jgi:hypothetical protein
MAPPLRFAYRPSGRQEPGDQEGADFIEVVRPGLTEEEIHAAVDRPLNLAA